MKPGKKKILIVDDDSDILELLKFTLESSHFECETALSATDGLQKALTYKPNLILLDLMLPEMSGFGFMRELKNNTQYGQIPVVVLTSLADEEIASEVMDLGAVGYLSKSCDKKELIAMVNEYSQH
jgi:two-component system phosphate regulon response regulator PhoB